MKLCTAYTIELGIMPSIFHSTDKCLNSNDFSSLRSQIKPNGTCPTIKVQDRLGTLELHPHPNQIIQHLGLAGVDLKEGTGRNRTAKMPDGIHKIGFTPDNLGLASQDHIGHSGIHIMSNTYQFRNFLRQSSNELLLSGQIARTRN